MERGGGVWVWVWERGVVVQMCGGEGRRGVCGSEEERSGGEERKGEREEGGDGRRVGNGRQFMRENGEARKYRGGRRRGRRER